MILKSKALLSFLAFLFLSACGQPASKMTTVRLATGLEHRKIPSLLDSFFSIKKLIFTVPTNCQQTEILAGWRHPWSDRVFTFPVYLTTPMVSASSIGPTLTYDSIAEWMMAGDMGAIDIPAPRDETLEFEIVGALYASTTSADGETCDDSSSGVINNSYSLHGRTIATIDGPTVVPINLWLTHAQPNLSNSELPENLGSACDRVRSASPYLSP